MTDEFEMYSYQMLDFVEEEPDERINTEGLHVFSRDWTIESVAGQIEKGNIDLSPSFQRRNVWNDVKRSGLIESIILDLPIPEIVLAEHPNDRKKYIVIDGKQRLLSIAGFVLDGEYLEIWDNHGRLRQLRIIDECNGATYQKLNEEFPDYARMLDNGTVRCTVIGGYANESVLYEVFHRLNTGSSPLSAQELRNVLHKGKFNDYLFKLTGEDNPLRNVLNLRGPDKRLKDIEILLRMISFSLFGTDYKGNLKKFLDDTSDIINGSWDEIKDDVKQIVAKIFATIDNLNEVFGDYRTIGRKYTEDYFELRPNRVLLEVEILTFMNAQAQPDQEANKRFLELFKNECGKETEFRSSIESTTKTLKSYYLRYSKMTEMVNEAYGTTAACPYSDPESE